VRALARPNGKSSEDQAGSQKLLVNIVRGGLCPLHSPSTGLTGEGDMRYLEFGIKSLPTGHANRPWRRHGGSDRKVRCGDEGSRNGSLRTALMLARRFLFARCS